MNSLPIRRNGKSTFEGLAFSASVAQTWSETAEKLNVTFLRAFQGCFQRVTRLASPNDLKDHYMTFATPPPKQKASG